jgi:hypothetical protein
MVTDGVIESRTRDIDQSIARLRERATTLRAEPLPDLVADLADLADTSLRDDLTILAVRLN